MDHVKGSMVVTKDEIQSMDSDQLLNHLERNTIELIVNSISDSVTNGSYVSIEPIDEGYDVSTNIIVIDKEELDGAINQVIERLVPAIQGCYNDELMFASYILAPLTFDKDEIDKPYVPIEKNKLPDFMNVATTRPSDSNLRDMLSTITSIAVPPQEGAAQTRRGIREDIDLQTAESFIRTRSRANVEQIILNAQMADRDEVAVAWNGNRYVFSLDIFRLAFSNAVARNAFSDVQF